VDAEHKRLLIATYRLISAYGPAWSNRFQDLYFNSPQNTKLHNTINDRLPGTYNLVFRSDGRLIAHPDYIQQIQQAEGQLKINAVPDSHLQQIFRLVKQTTQKTVVLENAAADEYLAVTQLDGPGWYFVTVYPKSLLAGAAFSNVQFVLIAGGVALLIEILLLRSVLRQQISKPLKQLTYASQQLANGNFDIHLDTTRQDELGQLSSAFSCMVSQLSESFMQLEQANAELEERVQKRTEELQAAPMICAAPKCRWCRAKKCRLWDRWGQG
jgi:methyl-accepting chemotaxis protein